MSIKQLAMSKVLGRSNRIKARSFSDAVIAWERCELSNRTLPVIAREQRDRGNLLIVSSIFCGLLIFLSIPTPAFAQTQKKSPIVTTERNIGDSYKDILKENQELKTAKKRMDDRLAELNKRMRDYQRRITTFQNNIDTLVAERQKEKKQAASEKQQLQTQIKSVEKERQSLEYVVTALENEKENNDYYTLWTATKEELAAAKKEIDSIAAEVRDMSVEQASLSEENGKLHYNLGNLFFEKGEYELALVEYDHALQILPNDPDIYYNMAVLYDYHLKNQTKAKYYYDQYLKKNQAAEDIGHVKERIAENTFRSRYEKEGSEL